jgi:hypothetical protein
MPPRGGGGSANDVAEAEDDVDPCELAWSYDFGVSSVAVGHIQ